jgi:hypothetical protein
LVYLTGTNQIDETPPYLTSISLAILRRSVCRWFDYNGGHANVPEGVFDRALSVPLIGRHRLGNVAGWYRDGSMAETNMRASGGLPISTTWCPRDRLLVDDLGILAELDRLAKPTFANGTGAALVQGHQQVELSGLFRPQIGHFP